MEWAYLLFSLICPLSMVGLLGWWAWSMRRSHQGNRAQQTPVRSGTDENEITRMRAQLDQLEAQARDRKATTTG